MILVDQLHLADHPHVHTMFILNWSCKMNSLIIRVRTCLNAPEWENRFTSGLNAADITAYIKNMSNESCLELNFIWKSQRMRIAISPRSAARWPQRFAIFEKIIMHPNGKIGSHRGWLLQKLQIYIEKCFKRKLFRIKFYTKTQWTLISIFPKNGARGIHRYLC